MIFYFTSLQDESGVVQMVCDIESSGDVLTILEHRMVERMFVERQDSSKLISYMEKLKKLEIDPSLRSYEFLLCEYARLKLKYHFMEVLERMKSAGYVSNGRIVSLVIVFFSRILEVETAEDLLNTSKFLTNYAYLSLIHAYSQILLPARALNVFWRMRYVGRPQSPFTYNLILNMFSKIGDEEFLLEFYYFFKKQHDVPPDQHTFVILLDFYFQSGTFDVRNLRKFRNLNGKVESHSTSSLRRLFSSDDIRSSKLSEVFSEILEEMDTLNIRPGIIFLNQILKISADLRNSDLVRLSVSLIEEFDCIPNLATIHNLIFFYCTTRDISGVHHLVFEGLGRRSVYHQQERYYSQIFRGGASDSFSSKVRIKPYTWSCLKQYFSDYPQDLHLLSNNLEIVSSNGRKF
eukprot:TRINITY_DN3586_c0_g4_i3.p1 TRINITY_DN3586_c0_g4~~TRINITY_DN3586_c0_g4_i3.p1  ORF type:complete len:405 (-),score=87.54 TRINITY_DN3586_c0_g4_i3:409-1623(-)